MKNIKDILKLRFKTEISYRQISRAVNVPSSTVSDYCKRFVITKYEIDDFLEIDEDKIYQLLFPEKIKVEKLTTRPLPNFEYIHSQP